MFKKRYWLFIIAIFVLWGLYSLFIGNSVPVEKVRVTEIAAPELSVYVCPGYLSTRPGSTYQFTAFIYKKKGTHIPITKGLKWSCDPRVGKISSTGLFTAGKTKRYFSKAIRITTADGFSANTIVEIASQIPKDDYVIDKSWEMNPHGVSFVGNCCVDSRRNVYVTDRGTGRLVKYHLDGSYSDSWKLMNQTNDFLSPDYVTTDSKDNIYVLNQKTHTAVKMTPDGKVIKLIPLKKTISPKALAVGKSGDIYVLDHKSLVRLGPDGSFIMRWKTAEKVFWSSNPKNYSLAVSMDEKIYVVSGESGEYSSTTIRKYNSSGRKLAQWSRTGPGGCMDADNYIPTITVDSKGFVYTVSDPHTPSIGKYDPNGKHLKELSFGHYISIWNTHLSSGPDGSVYFSSDYLPVVRLDKNGRASSIQPR